MAAKAEPGKETSVANNHPFSDSIISAPLPERFKLPMMEKYDGLSDAEVHLAAFNAHMLFYEGMATDALKCRAFPTTLTKFAIRWFFTLPPNSINSFSDLSAKFIDRFALTIDFPKTYSAVRDLQQGPNESLRDYINRFNEAAVKVENLHPDFAMFWLREGLKPGPCANALFLPSPQNLREVRRIAAIFIDSEEDK